MLKLLILAPGSSTAGCELEPEVTEAKDREAILGLKAGRAAANKRDEERSAAIVAEVSDHQVTQLLMPKASEATVLTDWLETKSMVVVMLQSQALGMSED